MGKGCSAVRVCEVRSHLGQVRLQSLWPSVWNAGSSSMRLCGTLCYGGATHSFLLAI